jgi:propane monooxygenase reductase subunit
MANTPGESEDLSFIIKKYPGGKFSARLDGDLVPGTRIGLRGPFGTCFRREGRTGPMILVGGGSGMSPLWSILDDHIESGAEREVLFVYGARTRRDLFYLDRFAAISARHPSITFVPALSHANGADDWAGERGFVHEVLSRRLKTMTLGPQVDVYACGPGPMIDAITPVLLMNDIESDRIFFDRFTPAPS